MNISVLYVIGAAALIQVQFIIGLDKRFCVS